MIARGPRPAGGAGRDGSVDQNSRMLSFIISDPTTVNSVTYETTITRSSVRPPGGREEPDAQHGADESAGDEHAAELDVEFRLIELSPLVVEDATICAVWVATATAGGIPRKIRSGVRRKPPPIPKRPETIRLPRRGRGSAGR